MVERWSSKPHVWVRFLLSLLMLTTFVQTRNLNRVQRSFENKRLQKSIKRFTKKKRIMRRWKSWFFYKNRNRVMSQMPLWIYSKMRYKSDIKRSFNSTQLPLRHNSKRRRRKRLFFKFLKHFRSRKGLKRFGTSRNKRSSRKNRGLLHRFVLSQYKLGSRTLRQRRFKSMSRKRRFINTYRYTRTNRTLYQHLKFASRVSSQKKSATRIRARLSKKLSKLNPFNENNKILRGSASEPKKFGLSKYPTRFKLRSLFKHYLKKKTRIRSSQILRKPRSFYYTLLWKSVKDVIPVSVTARSMNSEFIISKSLNIFYLLNEKHTTTPNTNYFPHPVTHIHVFGSIKQVLLNSNATTVDFLRKFKINSQIISHHHHNQAPWFSTNRLNQLGDLELELNEDGILLNATPVSEYSYYEPNPSSGNSTTKRRLRRTVESRRRRRPRQRGSQDNRRLTQSHHKFSLPNTGNRLDFLNKHNYINSLNKLFIRVLRVKITHYRISTREFFSQYLIRLNPRHVVYKTVNYVHFFRSESFKKLLEPSKRFGILPLKTNSQDLTRLNQLGNYVDLKALSARIHNFPYDKSLCGLFNFLSLLQDEYLFTGYWHSNKRRRRLVRRKWQFKRVFARKLFGLNRPNRRQRPQSIRKVRGVDTTNSLNTVTTALVSKPNLLNDLLVFQKVMSSPSYLLNYLAFPIQLPHQKHHLNVQKNLALHFSEDLGQNFFNNRVNMYNTSNLVPREHFSASIKRKLLKLFKFHRFSKNVVMWYYSMLIRFMEFCSGKKIYIKFNPFLENYLTFTDLARCSVWIVRVRSFKRMLGPKIFLDESLKIVCLSLRYKDPTFLSNWLRGMLYRMSFWKYRLLFRYLKFLLRYLFYPYFNELGFKGLKLRLKGKISVAGNARTRTLRYAIGETSYSQFNHRVVSDFSTINTFTGVLGFRIWLFF